MKRLKNNQFTIYDAQIIIYYCFLYKKHRIIELTNKARTLTDFLIKNDINIIVPESIINEIFNKGFGKIISDYTSSKSPNQIIGLTKKLSYMFEYRLQRKIEENFNNMINSNWFEVKPYTPPEISVNSIRNFFENIEDKTKLEEFLTKKRRDNPTPSKTDIELIAFSKDIESPLISNDYDITFFAEELLEKELSNKIYAFRELDFYNN